MDNYSALLNPGFTYHVYNRANGNDVLFTSEANYQNFLLKYTQYISPIADTFCYCLMPNHIHFLLRLKEQLSLQELQGFENLEVLAPKFISGRFSNFFNAYAKAFNKQQGRNGNLFTHNFKRKLVTDTDYLRKLVQYIHANPVEAGLCQNPEQWGFSSYNAIISPKTTFVLKYEVIEWFADLENFIYCHKQTC